MNILYCGDSNIVDGLIISILSLIKHESGDLNIYVFSMDYEDKKSVSEKAIKLIRLYYLDDIKKIESFNVSKSIVNEINRFIDDYYERYTGLYLNSKEIVNNMFDLT